MQTTIALAHRFGMTPYEVLREDAETTIDLFNSIIETAPPEREEPRKDSPKEERRRVTPETSTGGWY